MSRLSRVSGSVVLAVMSVVALPVLAAGPDVSDLVAAVDFGTVITGVLAVFAIGAGVAVAIKAGSLILGAIKRT